MDMVRKFVLSDNSLVLITYFAFVSYCPTLIGNLERCLGSGPVVVLGTVGGVQIYLLELLLQ